MIKAKLGELVTLNTHPFPPKWKSSSEDEKKIILIGADPDFIPPIMVVCEVLNNIDNSKKVTPNQVRGVFYSHKNHKYERHWFKAGELKKILNEKKSHKPIVGFSSKSLPILRDSYINKYVILRNVDVELNKEKVSQEQKNFDSVSLRRHPHLDFVPPVMTVIDVRILDATPHKPTGKHKRVTPKFEFKCKYFNPYSSTFSEDWIAPECLLDITDNFSVEKQISQKDKFVLYPLDVLFENSEVRQINTVVWIKEIVFNHYEYLIKAEDIWTHRIINIDMDHDCLSSVIDIDNILLPRIPNRTVDYPLQAKNFTKGNLYEIEYVSDRGSASKRLIYIVDKYSINESTDTLIVANCLLRNGKLRHFKVSNIKSSRRVKRKFENLFIVHGEQGEE